MSYYTKINHTSGQVIVSAIKESENYARVLDTLDLGCDTSITHLGQDDTVHIVADNGVSRSFHQPTTRVFNDGVEQVISSSLELATWFDGHKTNACAADAVGSDPLASSGYSHSGGFAGKPLENSYVWQPGAGISYTSADVTAQRYKVFSLDNAVHEAVDNPYWSIPDVSSLDNVGLFNGYALPGAVTSLFDFTHDFDAEYPGSTDTGFEGSIGRIRLNDLVYGDELRVRFDFNVIPQIANTTVEVALWYANRDNDDNITFTFPLTTSPIFYGTGSVGNTYLNRPEISAWIISNEDVNALTLPAIKADNPVIIQPLGLKVTIIR